MDVIHKVFVSSTYTDLRLERAAVERTLLHLKCFPIGMEIFPAANDSAWDFIKQQIDDSDYYVLIIAARYGSIDPETGKSYTEMEFDYASERGIPILAFIHEDPGRIHDMHRDSEPEKKVLLDNFRHKVQSKKLCKLWKSVEEIEARVATTITSAKDLYKREGFVRASLAVDHKRMAELLEANRRLEQEIENFKRNTPAANREFAKGRDPISLVFTTKKSGITREEVEKIEEIEITEKDGIEFFRYTSHWDEVLSSLGNILMKGCTFNELMPPLAEIFEIFLAISLPPESKFFANRPEFRIRTESLNTVELQFQALGWVKSHRIERTDLTRGSFVVRELFLTDLGMIEFGRLSAIKPNKPVKQ